MNTRDFVPQWILPGMKTIEQSIISKCIQAISKHTLSQYTKPFGSKNERNGTLAFARSLLHDQDWFEDLWQDRSRINDKPALFIWGMKDTFVPPGTWINS